MSETPQKSTPLPRPKTHGSILRRIVGQSLLISAFTILFLSTLSFILARSMTTQQRLFDQLSAVATSKKDAIENALQLFRQHAFLISGDERVLALIEGKKISLEPVFQELQKKQPSAKGITVYDSKKNILATAGERSPSLFANPEATVVIPFVDRKAGWQAVYTYVPLRGEDGTIFGYIGVKYSVTIITDSIFADITSSIGKSAEVTIGQLQGGEIFVVHNSRTYDPLRTYSLGDATQIHLANTPLALAVKGNEGVRIGQDERGESVFFAYRFLPSLGWGMVVKMESSEAFSQISQLAFALLIISFLLMGLSGLIGFSFARRLTKPLLQLVEKIRTLSPGHWEFERSVHTGDEVEMLDEVIFDLSTRLQSTYTHLEELVNERTRELKKQFVIDRAILDGIQYGVVSVDAAGKIIDMNPAAVRLLGFTKEDCTGHPAEEVLVLHRQKGDLAGDAHPVRRCLEKNVPFRASATSHLGIMRKDQTYLPVMMTVTPLGDDQGMLGALVVFLDVSEERQTDYMKSEFISLASHQLRTPLSSLRWYLELLTAKDMPALTEEQRNYVSEIERSSRRMANLLDTLLRVAQLDDRGMIVEKKDVNGVEIISRIVEELSTVARDEGIRLNIDVPAVSVSMNTDPVLVSIILQNLISNAIKYSPRGSKIDISLNEKEETVRLSVKDYGMGIPHSEQARVFQKFFRAKNIRDLMAGGTGLGLYLSKRITENLGGDIAFESTEGKGTEFTVTLPKK